MSRLRRLWNTVRPGRIEREIEREMAFHLAERIDDLVAQGLTREQATRRARVADRTDACVAGGMITSVVPQRLHRPQPGRTPRR